jgi:hypothetical protein
MEEGFPEYHSPWVIVEVMKDTDPSGEPQKKSRFFYFLSNSTGPEEDFSFKDQTRLGMFRSRFNHLTEVGLFRKLSVQIRCPDCGIMHQFNVWLDSNFKS